MAEDDFERELRASLAENAKQAPRGDFLAERIIHLAQTPTPSRPPHWRSWLLPVVAAAAVLAVIAGVLTASHVRSRSTADRPDLPPSPAPASSTTAAPSPASSSATVVPPPIKSSVTPESSRATSTPSALRGFRVIDLTFVSADEGWALGSADCISDPSKTCSAIQHTIDGGQHWTSVPTHFDVPATDPTCQSECVQHLRFAYSEHGYAYGSGAFYSTSNGGQTWTQEPGVGVTDLAAMDGTVMRIAATTAGVWTLQVAPIGSSDWQPITLPESNGIGPPAPVSITRTAGHRVYVVAYLGSGMPGTGVYSSTDDGATWTRTPVNEDGISVVAGLDGSALVLTYDHQGGIPGQTGWSLDLSSDGGATFRQFRPTTGVGRPISVGIVSSKVLFYATDALYRSANAGATWTKVASEPTYTVGYPSTDQNFLGFENDTTGRWISGDGSTIWTTTDAGVTWQPYHFG